MAKRKHKQFTGNFYASPRVITIDKEALLRHDEKLINESFCLLMALCVETLHDQFGFTTEDGLPTFAEVVVDRFSEINLSDVDWTYYSDYVFEKTGMRIEPNDNRQQ